MARLARLPHRQTSKINQLGVNLKRERIMAKPIGLEVNDKQYSVNYPPDTPLLYVLDWSSATNESCRRDDSVDTNPQPPAAGRKV